MDTTRSRGIRDRDDPAGDVVARTRLVFEAIANLFRKRIDLTLQHEARGTRLSTSVGPPSSDMGPRKLGGNLLGRDARSKLRLDREQQLATRLPEGFRDAVRHRRFDRERGKRDVLPATLLIRCRTWRRSSDPGPNIRGWINAKWRDECCFPETGTKHDLSRDRAHETQANDKKQQPTSQHDQCTPHRSRSIYPGVVACQCFPTAIRAKHAAR